MSPTPNLSWWQRVVQAIGVGLSKPTNPLPPDAQKELDRWDVDEVAEYNRTDHEAPPDAPHIDEGGI